MGHLCALLCVTNYSRATLVAVSTLTKALSAPIFGGITGFKLGYKGVADRLNASLNLQ